MSGYSESVKNTKPYSPRYTKAIKQEVVDAIIQGELFLEEAMIKYEIVDRRTVIQWLRKYLLEDKKMRSVRFSD